MQPFSQAIKKKGTPKPPDEKLEPVDNAPTSKGKRKFFVYSEFGELLDLAIWLEKVEKYETLFYVDNPDYKKIGKGIVRKADNWHDCLGKGYIWVVDSCSTAKWQDWLREKGEYVVGSNVEMAECEDNRQKGQEWFKEAGFYQPFSDNFTDIEDARDFIEENEGTRFILKQNGAAPKHLNHPGKFDSGVDMLFHLDELEKGWNTAEFGEFDCDLMEVVEGIEVAASAFFNGKDWLRNSEGKVVGFLNFESKKQLDGDLGETTGETGTTFIGVDEDNKVFADILLRPEITKKLKECNFKGVFDINGSLTKDGYVGFEPTSRFGVPATSYEFTEGIESNTGEMLEAMAMGLDTPIKIKKGVGMVVVVFSKPFPVEESLEKSSTSLGEKLWILHGKEPVDEFSKDQMQHIHLENFEKDDGGNYRVATKNGYLLTVTGSGKDIESTRESLNKYIKENVYIKGNGYRQDIGKRIEPDYEKFI